MSLPHASHARMAPADELVPSRYAVRVGEIDVLVISDGVLPITTSTLATNADPAELAGESLVATHLPFPSVCRVAVAGNVFRCVPTVWDY
ncbi:hypothetical protein CKJ56_00255 [Mycobacterium intracellulare subsp. chimaera]|nr:hypothetical protein CKJ58_00900 [Mycobacterium intracellulare subsp. chimaera]PBA61449.1 hypothetical protein CKJ56_00255 [Mycobacterium intracellulare subsp. chimaera]